MKTMRLLAIVVIVLLAITRWDAGWAAEPIVLGQSLPLQAADVDGRGERIQAGALALVESVNARGGIGGRPLKLVTLNNDNDLALHRQNLRQLAATHKAVAWINCLGDEACTVAASEAEALRVPLVGVHSGLAALVRAREPRVFRIRPGYAREADALALQLRTLSIAPVALVSDELEGSLGDEPVRALQASLEREGVRSGVLRLPPVPAGIDALLGQFGQGGYAAAVLLLRAPTIARIVDRGADRRPEWPPTLLALSHGTLNAMLGNFGGRPIGYSMVVPHPDRGALALARELQQAAERSGGPVATNLTGFEAYIAARIVVEGLRRCGPRIDAENLFAALDALGDVDLAGFRVNLSRHRASASDFIDMAMRPRLASR